MRLEPHEVRAIKAATRLTFGSDAVVRGSRMNDQRRGGDIDLHVEAAPERDVIAARARFEDHLFARIKEEQVDLIVYRRGASPSGIDLIAWRDGVLL